MRKLVSLLLLLSVAPLSGDDAPTEDPRWAEAMASYLAGRDDEGHNSLVALVEDHPGDLDLAATCYRTIIREEGTIANTNPWINFASEQILALERLGALSANSFTKLDSAKGASSKCANRSIASTKRISTTSSGACCRPRPIANLISRRPVPST